MKITEKHMKELRSCELYQSILPRYQKSIEWMLKEYIKATEEENIETKVYFVNTTKSGSLRLHSPLKEKINRRRLLNLGELGFDFGLHFSNDEFMPFFGESEVALFDGMVTKEDLENGDICLVKNYYGDIYLVTKEETGFFELDCTFLDDQEKLNLIGRLVNIETK